MLGALAVLVGVLAGCGGGGEPSVAATGAPIGFERLAQAASTSADAESGRFSFGLEVTMPGAEDAFSFSGEGAFDNASERASFSVDLSSFAALLGGFLAGFGGSDAPDFGNPDAWKIDVVRDGSVSYVRFPALAKQLPAGASWIRGDDGQTASTGGLELDQLAQLTEADPRELLELLRGVSGDVEVVGTEVLRGTETTRYRATLDAASVEKSVPESEREDFRAFADQLLSQSGLAEIPLDVWVDADGLLRKFELDVAATQPGASEPSRATVTFELWDVGERVEIELPTGSEVVDAADLKR